MGLDVTSYANGLKHVYQPGKWADLTYKNNPFLALVPKTENMGGDQYEVPVMFGATQARSSVFSTAQTLSASKNVQVAKFSVTRVRDYGITSVSNEVIKASKGNPEAFMNARTAETDSIIRAVTNRLATAIYRSGYGEVGQYTGTPGAGYSYTMKTAADINNIEPGMELVFSSALSGAALRQTTALVVQSVDRNAGTFVGDLASNAITSLADGDYIFTRGDRTNTTAYTDRLVVSGFTGWVPQSAPTSALWFGQDRTKDSRLGGCRYDGSTVSIEEALNTGVCQVGAQGGNIDHVFLGWNKYAKLVNSMTGKKEYNNLKVGDIGFRSLVLNTDKGEVQVLPDRNCPDDLAALVQMDTWEFGSLGKAPDFLDDGKGIVQYNADGIEIRVGWYGNLFCKAPGFNCNVKL